MCITRTSEDKTRTILSLCVLMSFWLMAHEQKPGVSIFKILLIQSNEYPLLPEILISHHPEELKYADDGMFTIGAVVVPHTFSNVCFTPNSSLGTMPFSLWKKATWALHPSLPLLSSVHAANLCRNLLWVMEFSTWRFWKTNKATEFWKSELQRVGAADFITHLGQFFTKTFLWAPGTPSATDGFPFWWANRVQDPPIQHSFLICLHFPVLVYSW